MNKMPRVAGKEMIRFLEKQGFVLRRVTGSHYIMVKGPLHVPIPMHRGKQLKTGTLSCILRLAQIKPAEFQRLWKAS